MIFVAHHCIFALSIISSFVAQLLFKDRDWETGDLLKMEPMSSLFVLGSPSVGNRITIKPNELVSSVRDAVLQEADSSVLDDVSVLYSKNLPMTSAESQVTLQQASNVNNLNVPLFNTTIATPTSNTGY